MSEKVKWYYNILREGAIPPKKATKKAACYDVYAWMKPVDKNRECAPPGRERECCHIRPGQRELIKTGINLYIPDGYDVQVVPRSGLAYKNMITVLNTPGEIDSDYRGKTEDYELKVILINHDSSIFTVEHGDRIAQIKIEKLVDEELCDGSNFDWDDAGSDRLGGFGSTGITEGNNNG